MNELYNRNRRWRMMGYERKKKQDKCIRAVHVDDIRDNYIILIKNIDKKAWIFVWQKYLQYFPIFESLGN